MAAAVKKLAEVNRLYKFKKPDVLDEKLISKLPEAYKKFFREWKMTVPSAVHYRENPAKWERNPETGEVKVVQNVPILPRYPLDSHNGLWGGEGIVQGFSQKKKKYAARIPHFWFPLLKRSVIYSEILNKYMSVVVTERTIDLILDNQGLDHYLLKSKACDIQSLLGLKLKRKMLMALLNKDLYPDDEQTRDAIYKKYKHYLDNYTEEEIDWYGLDIREALWKFEQNEESKPPQPLKYELRKRLVDELKEQLFNEMNSSEEPPVYKISDPSQKSTWLSKLNPFGGSKKDSST